MIFMKNRRKNLLALVLFAFGLSLRAEVSASAPARTTAKVPQRSPKRAVALRLSGVEMAAPGVRSVDFEQPRKILNLRTQRVISELRGRPVRAAKAESAKKMNSGWNKTTWLKAVYSSGLVEANWSAKMLSDKLIFANLVSTVLGARSERYVLKTAGLRDILFRNALVDSTGQLTRDGDRIEEALSTEFPNGFLVRPAVGVTPRETTKGLFNSPDEFIVELLRAQNSLYQARFARVPMKSHILGGVASGEGVVLQENFVQSLALNRPLAKNSFQEIRIHTYEHQVVPGASPKPWVQKVSIPKSSVEKAEQFVGEMLAEMQAASPRIFEGMAFGIDVGLLDNGEMRVLGAVTNRGKPMGWSGYLEQPKVLGAYARFFEKNNRAKFIGLAGVALRWNLLNYWPYWELRVDRSQPGMAKVLALFPPIF
jgi:hypothetical protein